MKVFVVINSSHHYDSSYYDIICISKSWEGAAVTVETASNDFRKASDKGELKSFIRYKEYTDEEIPKEFNCSKGILFEGDNGFYELFAIEEHELKD